MKKLFENFGITASLMLFVAIADYIILPIGGFDLGIGLIIVFLYFAIWMILKRRGILK